MKRIKFTNLLFSGVLFAVAAEPQSVLSVNQYFRSLVNRTIPAATPEELERAINASGQDDLRIALPTIFTLIPDTDKTLAMQGAMALFGVGQRPDSAELLAPFLGRLYDMLETPWGRFSLSVLVALRPMPPPEASAPMLAYLERTDQDTMVQTGAAAFLLQRNPGEDRTIGAVSRFAARSLDAESRVRLMDMIVLFFKGNERMLPVLAASIHDERPLVKGRAIYELARLGPGVLDKYAADLRAIAIDPNETPEVRGSAEQALSVWAGAGPH